MDRFNRMFAQQMSGMGGAPPGMVRLLPIVLSSPDQQKLLSARLELSVLF
jgi:hypothetical protein